LSEREAKVEDYQELDLKRMVFTREKRWFGLLPQSGRGC
jgi:hypothetical protein